MGNKVKFKIGEIEFEAEGEDAVIERERNVFLTSILPAAIEAVVKTRTTTQANTVYLNSTEDEVKFIECRPLESQMVQNDIDLSRTNLVTFLKKYGVLSDQDFVVFSAYYDEKKNGMKSFSTENVKKYYAEARRQEYSNISMLLGTLAKKGYIMDDPDSETSNPKQYILTGEGIEYVEKYVPKPEEKQKQKKISNKTKKSKVESQYTHINADDLKMDKYIDICSLEKFKDQMLMAMYIITMEEKGVYFSVADIQYILIKILGISATERQIRGVIERNRTWFDSEQDPNNAKANIYRLLDGGKKYAKALLNV